MEIISPYTSVSTGAYMSRVSLPESPDNKGAKRSVQFVRPDRIIKATWQPSQCIKSSLIERNIPTIMGVPEMQSTHLLYIPFILIMSIKPNVCLDWSGHKHIPIDEKYQEAFWGGKVTKPEIAMKPQYLWK